jgi:hypothetical protein
MMNEKMNVTMIKQRNRNDERICKSLLKELPLFSEVIWPLSLILVLLVMLNQLKSKKDLYKLTCLYDLDLFSLQYTLHT